MSATKTLLTAEEFDNYPFEEDKRYELDEGELIEVTRPAYRHNRILRHLTFKLCLYFENHPCGELMISENLFAVAPTTRLAPDAAVILGNRQAELADAGVIHIVPEIVVEVLSPSERPRAVNRKLRQYLDAGVKEVWIIDPEVRSASIWTGPAERKLAGSDALTSPL